MSWTDKARVSAAAQAVRELKDHTTVGLGSGNTILRALELAAERIKKENLRISFIPTSYQIEIAAKKLGLKTANLDEETEPELALDGADQVQWRTLDLVKGGGAALLREKIVDSTARRLIIVVDEKKLAKTLGGPQPIPVEITPFGYASTLEKIRRISDKTILRETTGKVGHNRQRQPHRGCLLQKPPPSRNRARETQEDSRRNRNRTLPRHGRHGLCGKKGRACRHPPKKLKFCSRTSQIARIVSRSTRTLSRSKIF